MGAGKSIREGMGQATDRSSDECVETVITNALIVDWSGIYKVRYTSTHPNSTHHKLQADVGKLCELRVLV